MKGLKVFLALACCGLAVSAVADDDDDGSHPVALHIDAPSSNGGTPWLSESGWGLNFTMVVKAEDTLGYAKHYNWTNKGEFGFLVLTDPDECPWMDDDDWRYGNGGLAPAGCPFFTAEELDLAGITSDETYIEFRPDVDEAGMPDSNGDAGEMAELVDSAGSNGPEFQKDDAGLCVPDTEDSDCFKFGPDTGGEVVDGFGYGNDDDLPGLFIYIKAGTGLVYDEPSFDRSVPMGVHNLAGMLNSVTYDLSDLRKENLPKAKGQKGKPEVAYTEEARIYAHMNVPGQLVRNIMQYDACTGTPAFDEPPPYDFPVGCDGADAWRIDGGPTAVPPMIFGRGDAASIWQLENAEFKVYAFLVSGHAPDVLFDANGDGKFTDDAELAGYTVISNTDSIKVIELSNVICWGGGGSVMHVDLDDNGFSAVPIVCPSGPGGIGRPPR